MPYENRVCVFCENNDNEVENEDHFIFRCPAYDNLRNTLFETIEKPQNFNLMTLGDKLKILLDNPKNISPTANFIFNALDKRSKMSFESVV